MTMRPRPLLLLVAVLSALVLSACGDSGGESNDATAAGEQAPPKQLEKAVTTFVVNPRYGVKTVKVTSVSIDGDEATADGELAGGALDGQTVSFVLVKGKQGWEVKEAARFVGLDKPLLIKKFEEETAALPEKLTAAQVRCLTEEFSNSSQAQMEAMYLDHAEAAFLELGKRCKDA